MGRSFYRHATFHKPYKISFFFWHINGHQIQIITIKTLKINIVIISVPNYNCGHHSSQTNSQTPDELKTKYNQ